MSSITELNLLVEKLNEISPPPKLPLGVNFAVANSGQWVVTRVGAGVYAIRAVYQTTNGEEVTVKLENEVQGFLPAVTTAIRFTLSILGSSRHYWLPI